MMQTGIVGLGRMGASMMTRLPRGDPACVVHDPYVDPNVEAMAPRVALGRNILQSAMRHEFGGLVEMPDPNQSSPKV